MAVEDIHEDRNPGHRGWTKPQFFRWNGGADHRHHAIGRADDQTVAQRRDARRIAEEIIAPDRQADADPSQRFGQPEQNCRGGGKDGDKAVAFAMHRLEESRKHAGGHLETFRKDGRAGGAPVVRVVFPIAQFLQKCNRAFRPGGTQAMRNTVSCSGSAIRSVQTRKDSRRCGPKEWISGTSAASRP